MSRLRRALAVMLTGAAVAACAHTERVELVRVTP